MSPAERRSWLTLGVFATTAFAYVVLLPFLGPNRACGALGLFGLLGFVPFVGLIHKNANFVFDERDALIQSRSQIAAYSVFWVVFVVSTMGIWWFSHPRLVSTDILPIFPVAGWVTIALVQAVATLVQ